MTKGVRIQIGARSCYMTPDAAKRVVTDGRALLLLWEMMGEAGRVLSENEMGDLPPRLRGT